MKTRVVKVLLSALIPLLGVFLNISPAVAATRTVYVDKSLSGNCSNGTYSITARACTGSDGDGFTAINPALAAVTHGDTILVRSGTYRENDCCAGSSHVGFRIEKSITFKAYNNETVILTYDPNNIPRDTDGTLGSIVYIDITSRLPLLVEGFQIEGYKPLGCNPIPNVNPTICRGSNLELEWNGAIPTATGNATIRNNKFYNAGSTALGVSGTRGNLLIENNDFYDGGFTPREHGIYAGGRQTPGTIKTIRYNQIHNFSGYGIHIYSDTANNYEVYGNIIYNNQTGGLLLTGGNHKIFNNTIVNNHGLSGLVFYGTPIPSGDVVKNNIIWGNYSNVYNKAIDIDCGDDGGNNVFSNNIFGQVSLPSERVLCKNIVSSPHLSQEPLFITANPGIWSDFRLKQDSPAINAGAKLGATYQNLFNPNSSTWPPGTVNQNDATFCWTIGPFAFSHP